MNIYDDFMRQFARASAARDAFASFHSDAAAYQKAAAYAMSGQPQQAKAAPPDLVKMATGGFIGYVSARGWSVAVSTPAGSVDFVYVWSRLGRKLQVTVPQGRNDPRRSLATACACLAEQEPALQHWRPAFVEAGVTSA